MLAAVTPPAMAGFSCTTPLSCAREWEAAWKEGPAEILCHPEIFYAGCDILAELESADMSHIYESCREMAVLNVKNTAHGRVLLKGCSRC
jgi:hypothetical protein